MDAVVLEDGRRMHTNAVVSAAGAWMRELMPVPMLPHKGQMMSLREPESGKGSGSLQQGGGIGLTRVFFAEGCYIIPKRDGRIVVGSTVEVSIGPCLVAAYEILPRWYWSADIESSAMGYFKCLIGCVRRTAQSLHR